jgi:hypothetical protein
MKYEQLFRRRDLTAYRSWRSAGAARGGIKIWKTELKPEMVLVKRSRIPRRDATDWILLPRARAGHARSDIAPSWPPLLLTRGTFPTCVSLRAEDGKIKLPALLVWSKTT